MLATACPFTNHVLGTNSSLHKYSINGFNSSHHGGWGVISGRAAASLVVIIKPCIYSTYSMLFEHGYAEQAIFFSPAIFGPASHKIDYQHPQTYFISCLHIQYKHKTFSFYLERKSFVQ